MNFNPNAMSESNNQEEKGVGVPPPPTNPGENWDDVVDRLPGSDHAEIDAQVKRLAQGIMDAIDKRDHSSQIEGEKYVESGKDAIPTRSPSKTLEELAQEGREKYDFMYTGASTVGVEVLDPDTPVEEKKPVDPAAYREQLIQGDPSKRKQINYGRPNEKAS